MITRVRGVLVSKIYNARSNEFLRTISRLECIKQKKAVDVNVGLRDSLKTYAVKKQPCLLSVSLYIVIVYRIVVVQTVKSRFPS